MSGAIMNWPGVTGELTRSRPRGVSLICPTFSSASSTSLNIFLADSANDSPVSVSASLRFERMTSATPRCSSSRASERLTDDFGMSSTRDTALKLVNSESLENTRISSSSIIGVQLPGLRSRSRSAYLSMHTSANGLPLCSHRLVTAESGPVKRGFPACRRAALPLTCGRTVESRVPTAEHRVSIAHLELLPLRCNDGCQSAYIDTRSPFLNAEVSVEDRSRRVPQRTSSVYDGRHGRVDAGRQRRHAWHDGKLVRSGIRESAAGGRQHREDGEISRAPFRRQLLRDQHPGRASRLSRPLFC